MTSPIEQDTRKSRDRPTKAQLEQQLSEVRAALRERETEVATCQQQLQEARTKMATLEEMAEKAVSADRQLGQTLASLKDMSARSNRLRQELDDLKQLNQKTRQENEELRERAQNAEDNAARQTEGIKVQLREIQQQKSQLESRVQELQKLVFSLKQQLSVAEGTEEVLPEDIVAPKATFRIDLYARQGAYQGRIEHSLSRDRKSFSGLDHEAIVEFISRHLPQGEDVKKLVGRPLVRELRAIPAGADLPSKVVHHGEPFQVQVVLDLTNVAAHDLPLVYELSVYAKRLGDGPRQMLGKAQNTLCSTGVFSVGLPAQALATGTYRLEAALSTRLPEGEPGPHALEGRSFVQVW